MKTIICVSCDLRVPVLGIYPRKQKTRPTNRLVQGRVRSSIIQKSPKLEIAQLPVSWRMNDELCSSHNGLLCRNKEKNSSGAYNKWHEWISKHCTAKKMEAYIESIHYRFPGRDISTQGKLIQGGNVHNHHYLWKVETRGNFLWVRVVLSVW